MDIETWRLLQAADWEFITKALMVHGLSRAALLYPQRTTTPGELGLGQTVEDVVQQAIEQALTGERHYDPQKGDIVPWLKDQVNSLMDHLFKGVPFRSQISADSDDGTGAILVANASYESHQASQIAEIARANTELGVDRALEAAGDDADLVAIVEAVMDDVEPRPRHLAQHLNISIPEVNTQLQRLRRRISTLNTRKPLRPTDD